MSTIMPISIYELINTLIENKCINIKKTYKLYKEIIQDNSIIIKNIYCKNRRKDGELCLNRCIENSKCCGVHDEIMRNNRKKRNIWIREIKKFNQIEDIFEISHKEEVLDYIPEYTEIIIEPSAPLLEDIVNPPNYIQKPDECGNTIINTINTTDNIEEYQLQVDNTSEDKHIRINHLYIPQGNKDLQERFQLYRNNSIIDNNLVDYIKDYQFTIMDKPIEDYLDKLEKTNIKKLQIKGIRSHRIINELIAINISSYYKAYNKIPSTNFFYKYANTISNIISKIPK